MERNSEPAFFASSTKSFQLSGLSRGSHMTLCTSSVTYPWKRLSPCPRMKAFMSSLRLDKSSDIAVSGAPAKKSPAAKIIILRCGPADTAQAGLAEKSDSRKNSALDRERVERGK